MQRDGLVRRIGTRAGTTRPSHLFELTPEVEQLLSRAYVPLLVQLVETFSKELPGDQFERLLRKVGATLARALTAGQVVDEPIEARVAFASRLLNEQLGALTTVERNGHFVIRGTGCPLSALTGKYPGICQALETLVAEIVGASTRECCERGGRPRCCFTIG
jgi:predicted ArsR family transcriptional regulator